MRATAYSAILALVVTWSVACGGGSRPAESGAGATAPTTDGRQVSMDKASYPVFPNADSGADPSVPAEQGGRGFTGEGWETNTDYDLIGDPRAVKGGVFREYQLDFPTTLRLERTRGQHRAQLHDREHGLRDAARTSSDNARVHARARDALADLA